MSETLHVHLTISRFKTGFNSKELEESSCSNTRKYGNTLGNLSHSQEFKTITKVLAHIQATNELCELLECFRSI